MRLEDLPPRGAVPATLNAVLEAARRLTKDDAAYLLDSEQSPAMMAKLRRHLGPDLAEWVDGAEGGLRGD